MNRVSDDDRSTLFSFLARDASQGYAPQIGEISGILKQLMAAKTRSDNPTGERLFLSMTEEGPSEDYKMTMQRDRHGRWMPIRGERTMNIQKATEERRSFCVGESKGYGTFSIASAEPSLLHGEF